LRQLMFIKFTVIGLDIIPESERGQEIIKHQIYIIFHNIFLYIKFNMARYPAVIMAVSGIFSKKKDFMVSKNTDIVIEGFPRSGNSFAFVAFKEVQNREMKIAHHFHLPFQILYACKNNIPCIVVIRKPIDAVASFLIFNPYLSVHMALRYYITFYETISPYRDKFVTGTFDKVTTNYGKVIERLNKKYMLKYNVFNNTPESVKKCFYEIEKTENRIRGKNKFMERTIPRPSVIRDKLKPEVKKKIQKREYAYLLNRAEKIYRSYVKEDEE